LGWNGRSSRSSEIRWCPSWEEGEERRIYNYWQFSDDAIKYVENIEPKVILIDGRALAELMIDYNLGTTTAATFEIKRIDSDYFGEE